MSGPSDRRLDLNAVEEVAISPQENIWCPSFGPLTIGDSVMKNDMTPAVMAKNLLTPKDNRLLSKRSDELACAGFVSNMAQCLFARTRQVESLAAEHENKQLHMLAHSYSITMKRKLDQLQESEGQILNHQRFVSLFERHLLPSSSGAVPHIEAPNDQPLMSESGSSNDEGSLSSSSRFELAMLESSGPLLESCTKETLDDFRNCQTLANIGSSSFMSVGEGVVFYAMPIFRFEFTADLLEKNLLDSKRQLETLRQSCSIPRSVGMRLVHHEELPSEPLKDHLQRMLSFIGYVSGQLNPGFWDTLIGFYIIWMECGLGEPSFHQWRYCYKIRLMKACPGYVECACRSERERIVFGNIKLSGRELADVEKVLRVPKEDRHLGKLRPLFRKYGFQPLMSKCQRQAMEKVNKKGGTSTKKGKAPMLVPVDDILFHKGAHKHRVGPAPRPKLQEELLKITASKRAEVEAIECAAAIVAGEERRLLPLLPTIDHIFPPTMKSTDQEGDPSSSHKRKYKEEDSRRRSIVDELGELLDENESDRDRMMRLSSYVMTEYDDRLREVERYKAKFKENNQFVNDARKTSKALAEAIRLKDQHFESLKRRNGENVRLKKQMEGTRKQLETTILEVSKVKGELDSALVEVSELKRSIPTERDAAVQEFLAANFEKRKWMAILERYDNGSIIQKYRDEMDEYRQRGEAFVLAVNPSNEDDSDNEANGSGDTEDGGDGDAVEMQSDIVRGLASDEDDSYFKPERFSDRDVRELRPSCLNHLFIELIANGLHYIGCRMAVAQGLYSVNLLVIVLQVISVPWMAKGLAIGAPELVRTRATDANNFKRSIPIWAKRAFTRDSVAKNAKFAKDVLLYEVFYFCLSNGCQRFYFGPFCEVVNCNDCIVDLALSCRHWADQIKFSLGEWPRADHKSKRLGRGVMNSCVTLTLIT
ncbi:hypothetical protein D8674_030653 [Pyrus ussuriensis x Pyrus communis]|uniref:Uncharacterized protein n=1 Tax=Pyrus ussuriensis x Pyrus communis TaxID=2448454 RepID=A0A5N5EXE0_9ROSA|nr:hypothetical protein D8674_030653 [Pyrus ussuriensis x Pyrus communis]